MAPALVAPKARPIIDESPPSQQHPTFRAADRLSSIGVSKILQIVGKANALKREGRDVIGLGAGEPDFDTPEHIKAAAARAIASGDTKYTALDGAPQLKAAIREKFVRDNKLDFAPEQISVSAGAKQVIFNALMASLNPGDEVILPAPFWTSYADMVLIAGGVPVITPCREVDGFKLTAEALEGAITPLTSWVILNSPSNPSGAVYGENDYRPLLQVLHRHPHVRLLADDIYEFIVYDAFRFVTPAALDPTLGNRILTVNGVSKAYAMTGWRVGYGAGPTELIKAMAVVQSQSTSNACSISQAAAVAALSGPQDAVVRMRQAFEARRNVVVEALNRIPGLSCRRPDGAFYAFASCAGLIGRRTPRGAIVSSDEEFCEYVLHHSGVAMVPGSCFGMPGYFRISYATSLQDLTQACERIAAACEELV